MRTYWQKLAVISTLATLILAAGCGGTKPAASQPAANSQNAQSGQKKQFTVALVQMTQDIPVQVAMKDGVEQKGKELGVKVLQFNGQFDVAKQISAIENYIQQKVDAILLNPADAAGITPAVEAANKAGIPVITFDTNAKGGKVTSFVESDNRKAGELVGKYIAWRLKGKGRIAILDYPYVSAVTDRTSAFNDVMKKYPDIKIVQTEIAADRAKGLKGGENILQAHSDIDGVFTINDPGGLGMAQAIKARNLDKKIFVAAIDGDPEAVKDIQGGAGPYELTVAQFGSEIGRQAMQTAFDALSGKKVSDHVLVPVMPVTKENAATFPGWAGSVPADLTPAWEKK